MDLPVCVDPGRELRLHGDLLRAVLRDQVELHVVAAVGLREDLEELDVRAGETDSVVKVMRAIGGVEIVAFLKEKDRNVIRVSFRSKHSADVAAIASKHKGGGHKKAAGCTLYMPIEEAVKLISSEVEEALKEL